MTISTSHQSKILDGVKLSRVKMETIYLSIDFGASSTKGFYGIDAENYFPLLMPPDYIQVDKELLSNFLLSSNPVDSAWIGFDGSYYALGYLAQTLHAIPTRKPLKTVSAIQKICAAVWIASQKLKLGQKFKISLNCVLPAGEMGTDEDIRIFREDVWRVLKNFETPTGVMKVGLSKFQCVPEGGGVLMFHQRMFTDANMKTIAIFMLGYRNSSVFFCRRGSINGYRSEDLGFSYLIDRVAAATVYKAVDLIYPLAKFQQTEEESYLLPLLRHSGDRGVAELEVLKKQVLIARRHYTSLIVTWMDETLDSTVDRLIICGGTADYLKLDLEKHFVPKFPKTDNGKSEVWFQGSLRLPPKVEALDMQNRMSDAYCLYVDLTHHTRQNK